MMVVDLPPGGTPPAFRVLLIGFSPASVDLSAAPISLATLETQIADGDAAVASAGYDSVSCQIGTDPLDGEAAVRGELARGPWDAVMIGGGVRAIPAHTELFERIVNTVHELAPEARFAFNSGPDTTLDALRRVLPGDRAQ
ncbi:hypothetical protein J7E83_11240 [Arthrobacter sp. ISL-48]|uniref:hypothetical protein n=1 Tax=Arthrobacter sp. ISL-48 TaxID=2819110 RepID=UPI001BEC714E|nr:hypothetical protein [Arthrobacter sp. ISL-48]MBT2532686.1 hypothetical protein [Arthrobacter sp. ISL-48]